jgi:hypothetical protein
MIVNDKSGRCDPISGIVCNPVEPTLDRVSVGDRLIEARLKALEIHIGELIVLLKELREIRARLQVR